MGISAVGALASATGSVTSTATLTVTTHAVGNAIVLNTKVASATITVSAVSGGNCAWTRISGPFVDTAGTKHTQDLWLGVVTAVGTATLTATLSSATSVSVDRDAQEFTPGVGSPTWTLDGTQAAAQNNPTASTTITYPTLTASTPGELYVGHARVPSGSSFSGLPAGFVSQTDANANPFIYNPNVSGTVSPTETDGSSSDSYTIAALIKVSGTPQISPVGTLVSSTGTSGPSNTTRTLAVTPQAVGDCLVLCVETTSTAIQVAAVTGGGCTWQKAGLYTDTDSNGPSNDEIWLGTVTTPGNATITVTFTASVAGMQVDLDAMEFASGLGPRTAWGSDAFAGRTNAASTTLTWPTLTPGVLATEMYVGRGRVTGTPGAISPAGFTSISDVDTDPFVYGLVSAGTGPTQTVSSSGVTVGAAALIYAKVSMWTKQLTLVRKSIPTAANNQLVAQTGDAKTIPATPGLSAGYVYLCRAYVDLSSPANTAYMAIPTPGVGMSNAYIGVYDPATGTLLSTTADVSAQMQAAGVLAAALTPTVAQQQINKELWLAVLIGAQTTSPGVVGRNSYGTNLGLTSDYRLWLSNTGTYTALPATAPAMSPAAATQSIPYIGIGP